MTKNEVYREIRSYMRDDYDEDEVIKLRPDLPPNLIGELYDEMRHIFYMKGGFDCMDMYL